MTTKTVHLAIYDTLADWEFGYATAHINSPAFQREPGSFQVRTVAETLDPITTMGGLRIIPDLTIADLDPEDSALLILSGADSWETGNEAFAKAARRFLEAGVPVAAICGATLGLAREGLLNDREHTSNVLEYLTQAEAYTGAAKYREERVVTDRHLITAGATGALEFARDIFVELGIYEPDVVDAWYGLYRTGDAEWFYKLVQASGQE